MKAVFLDRDGVINRYPGDARYVTCWKDFRFLPRVKDAIALLNSRRFPVFVISNQAGVAKGIYSQDTLAAITGNMLQALKEAGARIEAVYYCPHRDEDNCPCRKPKTGLLESAVKDKDVDLKESFFVGDTIRDVRTARAAGCRSILVLSGKEKLSDRKGWETEPDYVFKDLFQAAKFIAARD